MTHAVKLPVTAPIMLECELWIEKDGWNGVCRELSVTVRGSSFEDAKREMEAALKTRIEAVLHRAAGGHAA